jgi:hypothetical protein
MRLGAVRGFARYLHEVDPRVAVPAADLLPDKSGRAVLYLYTDAQIGALIGAASTLRIAHKTATFQTLFGLLAATGMRIGETLVLDRSDFDADAGTRTLRNAKFGKSRELPLHPTTTTALTRYVRRRDRPGQWMARGAAALKRGHKALDQRRADPLPGVAVARGDPAALGGVPAQAARICRRFRYADRGEGCRAGRAGHRVGVGITPAVLAIVSFSLSEKEEMCRGHGAGGAVCW